MKYENEICIQKYLQNKCKRKPCMFVFFFFFEKYKNLENRFLLREKKCGSILKKPNHRFYYWRSKHVWVCIDLINRNRDNEILALWLECGRRTTHCYFEWNPNTRAVSHIWSSKGMQKEASTDWIWMYLMEIIVSMLIVSFREVFKIWQSIRKPSPEKKASCGTFCLNYWNWFHNWYDSNETRNILNILRVFIDTPWSDARL